MRFILTILLFAFSASAQMPPRVLDDLLMARISSASSGATILDSMAAYWKLDETSGTRQDTHTNNLDLTLVSGNAVSYAVGIQDNGAEFNYANGVNALTCADDIRFSALANSLTVAGWAKSYTNGTYRYLICKDAGANGNKEWAVYYDYITSKWAVEFYTNAVTSTTTKAGTTAPTTNVWYFVCLQMDTTNRVAKIRSGEYGSTLGSWGTSSAWNGYGPNGTGTNCVCPLYLGRAAGTSFNFKGVADNFGVWDRLLSEQEITNFFSGTWPIP